MGARQSKEAGLRQCGRGKHYYGRVVGQKYENTCKRCGRSVRRRSRASTGDGYGPNFKH